MRRPATTPGLVVALGSAVGVAFGSTPFFSSVFAVLGAAWADAFGWSPAVLATAATLYLSMQIVAFPLAGWLLDRWGSRRVACASILMFGLTLVALSQMTGSALGFKVLLAMMGFTSVATNFVAYARVIASWFDRNRGLAIGLTASAQAVGIITLPLIVQRLIEASGWSAALLAVGGLQLLVCLPVVWLLVKEQPHLAPSPGAAGAPVKTARIGAVLRSPVFWGIAACIAVEGLTIYAILPNTAFILGQTAGLAAHDIAALASLSGIAFLFGRVGFGYLLDRAPARLLFVVMVAMVAGGVSLYATADTLAGVRVGAFLLGMAGGGQTDLMPYVASRYFGVQAVSTVFGLLLLAFFAGAAAAPVLFVAVAAAQGVVGALTLLAALQVVPAAVFAALPNPPHRLAALA